MFGDRDAKRLSQISSSSKARAEPVISLNNWLPAFTTSLWFTRGWTLLELLAPQNISFFSVGWNCLGTKSSLVEILTRTTRIPINILNGTHSVLDESIAKRFSWASHRYTTRPEDIAYCLLGLFDVNIPILYGEGGQKAFFRLQEELIRRYDDESIFAWRAHNPSVSFASYHGLLASSPADFRECGFISRRALLGRPSFQLTNSGVSMRMKLHGVSAHSKESGTMRGDHHGILACYEERTGANVAILMMCVEGEQWCRVNPSRVVGWGNEKTQFHEEQTSSIVVRQNWRREFVGFNWITLKRVLGFVLKKEESKHTVVELDRQEQWTGIGYLWPFYEDEMRQGKKQSFEFVVMSPGSWWKTVTMYYDASGYPGLEGRCYPEFGKQKAFGAMSKEGKTINIEKSLQVIDGEAVIVLRVIEKSI